ncbi:P63C domain-containing protein [endosymbiont GvMRE of Glomus versiforme]|uniref:P63C domain-containing protein n=1 Tax=endosymbiont GvMRE of Glomus versiforme TaxID=2039283 RepID=UPI000EE2D8AE|nr:P63C domain-containing protein [endosymbiont GvMRE of Glomus versiforme]RHZ37346.1 p63C domain protein [endosymbiont GvMRE of Glomus versiforme]
MNKNLIKHESKINLAGINLPCFILEDGTRILPKQGIQSALKIAEENELDRYLNLVFKNKSTNHFELIICYKENQKISGYEATRLIDICDGILEARIELREKMVDNQCKILTRLFTKADIITLIDKATGYQYEREKTELQVILKAFTSKEILKWQKTFQTDFYKEIFRLQNIPFTTENIRKKPRFVG